MNAELSHRPKWPIDELLEGLIGHDVRVAAESFSPARGDCEAPTDLIPVRELILPDNSQAGSLPVYFEGSLRGFVREIGVIWLRLGSPAPIVGAVEGIVRFRGKMAVILRGPAMVKLAFPFRVEKLPADADNYWRDRQTSRAQLKLPL
jgi:hypothetical protein